MLAPFPPLQYLLIIFAGWVHRQQLDVIEEENRVLREMLGDQRLRFTDAQRRRLAEKAKRLGQKVLKDIASIAPGSRSARRSTPNSFAAMLSDEADFSQAVPMYVPISREKGGKTKVVAQVVNPSAGASGEWDSHAAVAMMATVVIVSCQLARPWMKGILFVRMT